MQSVIVLLIVTLTTFTLRYFQNHGILAPAYAVLFTHATPHNVALWGVQNGMNHPYFARLWTYVTQVFFHFNLGHSFEQLCDDDVSLVN